MIEKDQKKSLKHLPAKALESSEIPYSSADFRETLLKSGIDASAFQADEQKNANLSEKHSVISSAKIAEEEYKSAKNQQAKNILESPEAAKKHSPKPKRWQHLTAISGIAAIIVLQSVFQFSFIQGENQRIAEDLAENAAPVERRIETPAVAEVPRTEVPELEQKPKAEDKTAFKKADVRNSVQPKKSAPRIQNEIREAPAKTAVRKKEQRESTTERIRRAEKILTGV